MNDCKNIKPDTASEIYKLYYMEASNAVTYSVGQRIDVPGQCLDIALVVYRVMEDILPCNGLWSAHAKCYISFN